MHILYTTRSAVLSHLFRPKFSYRETFHQRHTHSSIFQQISKGLTLNPYKNGMVEGKSQAPLVWVDCEMTGLDVVNDEIIQIACFVTDYDLNLLDKDGFETVVHFPQSRMDQMDAWCTKTHAKTGLTPRVVESKITPSEAAEALFTYVKNLVPDSGKAILAGNSVHYDKEFLRREPYGKFLDHLHHRILDVSSLKEAARRWSDPKVMKQAPKKQGKHEARQDILESIEEARFYRDVFFRPKIEDAGPTATEEQHKKKGPTESS